MTARDQDEAEDRGNLGASQLRGKRGRLGMIWTDHAKEEGKSGHAKEEEEGTGAQCGM